MVPPEHLQSLHDKIAAHEQRIAELETDNAQLWEFAWLAWMDDFTQEMHDYYFQNNPKAYACVLSIVDRMNNLANEPE